MALVEYTYEMTDDAGKMLLQIDCEVEAIFDMEFDEVRVAAVYLDASRLVDKRWQDAGAADLLKSKNPLLKLLGEAIADAAADDTWFVDALMEAEGIHWVGHALDPRGHYERERV